jgi:hypothetical protein
MSLRIVLDHVEARACALCILNCFPPTHCILHAAVQASGLCLSFGGLSERAEEAVVDPDVVILRNEIRVFLLDDA